MAKKSKLSLTDSLKNELEALSTLVGVDKFTDVELSRAIKAMSDAYIGKIGVLTPWNVPGATAAYVTYFHTRNTLRCLAALLRLKESSFFDKIDLGVIHEVGSGTGAFSFALQEFMKSHKVLYKAYFCEEKEASVYDLHQKWSETSGFTIKKSEKNKINDTLIMSYSMNELLENKVSIDFSSYKNIIIVEPSDSKHSKQLIKMRKKLIQEGFFIWGPCTHQEACPFIDLSEKFWCHDRYEFDDLPEKYLKLCKRLGWEPARLGFSYLAASRVKPEIINNEVDIQQGINVRFVGDPLKEKGKIRQYVCMDSKLRTMSVLKRNKLLYKSWSNERGEMKTFKADQLDFLDTEIRLKST